MAFEICKIHLSSYFKIFNPLKYEDKWILQISNAITLFLEYRTLQEVWWVEDVRWIVSEWVGREVEAISKAGQAMAWGATSPNRSWDIQPFEVWRQVDLANLKCHHAVSWIQNTADIWYTARAPREYR
jgi:hypothetical protein